MKLGTKAQRMHNRRHLNASAQACVISCAGVPGQIIFGTHALLFVYSRSHLVFFPAYLYVSTSCFFLSFFFSFLCSNSHFCGPRFPGSQVAAWRSFETRASKVRADCGALDGARLGKREEEEEEEEGGRA